MRTRSTVLIAAMAIGLFTLASCSSEDAPSDGSSGPSTQSATGSFDGDWTLADGSNGADDIKAVDGSPITLHIEGTRFSGVSGCNNFTTTAKIDGSSISLGPAASTMMACADDVMAVEHTFLTSLEGVSTIASAGNQLTLSGEKVMLTFTR